MTLPDSLSGWFTLLVTVCTAGAGVWAICVRTIRQPITAAIARDKERMDDRLRHHGERLGALDTHVSANTARMEASERAGERVHFQVTALAEHHGRLEERLTTMMNTLQQYHDQRVAEDRMLGERLARIEAKLDIPGGR